MKNLYCWFKRISYTQLSQDIKGYDIQALRLPVILQKLKLYLEAVSQREYLRMPWSENLGVGAVIYTQLGSNTVFEENALCYKQEGHGFDSRWGH
jgi:hypothetical protein